MLRSIRVRLVLSFVVVVAVAVGIAEVVASQMTTHEFDAYVGRVDSAYIQTLANNLGNYYATHNSWSGVESVLESLPQVPGRLQVQDNSGTIVGDTSPGRGPGPGGSSGTPGPQATPQGQGPGGSNNEGSGSSGTAVPGQQLGPGNSDAGPSGSSNGTGNGGISQNDSPMEDTALLSSDLEAADADGSVDGQAATPAAIQRIPIYANGQQVGTLVVVSQTTPSSDALLSDRFFDRVRLALVVGGITGLVLAAVFAFFLVGGITRPVRQLSNAARRIASGDFGHRVEITSPSEAAQIATSFNQMAEALEQDQETRRRLLSDIVHELRTPLSVIQGTAQGFVDGVIPADAAHAAVIRDEASLLNKLITDLRDIALAESGELRLERKPADLTELARQAVATVEPRAKEKGVEVELDARDELPLAFIDSDRTLQIAGNLLENALRHTPSGGSVSLQLSKSGGHTLMLSVADTGEGIPPEHLPHIFERFYRADPARPAGGTGLGLAIVKQLTEAQGGSVSVKSTPGQGSVFTVTLPASGE
jgi:signal transduction histidine kinase